MKIKILTIVLATIMTINNLSLISGRVEKSILDVAILVNAEEISKDNEIEDFKSDLLDLEKMDPIEGVYNLLLIGADDNQGQGYGRSDSMILASISDEIKLTSFQRDSFVNIEGYGKSKLNAAYSYGGPELLIQTLQDNFDIRVDDYMIVNFEHFAEIVDLIGGIDLHLSKAEAEQVFGQAVFRRYEKEDGEKPIYKKNSEIEEGDYHMNGEQTLSFCRIRKIDSDFQRSSRQRQVLHKIYEKAKTMTPKEQFDLFMKMSEFTETSISINRLPNFIKQILKVETMEFKELSVPVDHSFRFDRSASGAFIIVFDKEMNQTAIHNFINEETGE